MRPQINITLFPKKDRKNDTTPVVDTKVNTEFVEQLEAVATRIGKKIIVGGIVLIATSVILGTAGAIVTNALDTPDN